MQRQQHQQTYHRISQYTNHVSIVCIVFTFEFPHVVSMMRQSHCVRWRLSLIRSHCFFFFETVACQSTVSLHCQILCMFMISQGATGKQLILRADQRRIVGCKMQKNQQKFQARRDKLPAEQPPIGESNLPSARATRSC